MAFPGEGILTDLAKSLVDKTIKEVKYFRDFEDHVQNFVIEHNSLVAKRNKVQQDIKDAKQNENQIEEDVKNWIEEADNVIQKNSMIKQTWSYGWCPYWRYRQGKRLAKRTIAIRDHKQNYNFERVARPAELSSIKYHAARDFIDFESRKTKLKQLVEALEDGNHHMIGLQGMGGTGKTTLATQVGKQVEESKAFKKVIFVVVSNPPDANKIRHDIARPLGLKLEERPEAEHSEALWSRISNNEGKLLIILDDVWGELNLREIGIPSGPDSKNCYVLITTRNSKVCQVMNCQKIIQLHTLDVEDALRLFLFHARRDDDDSSRNDLDGVAGDFVKECGGLPIAIVALASTLRSWPRGEWNAVLTTLRNSNRFVDVDEDLVKVYRCLRLSYDRLGNEKAQQLLLLCSIFPEDYEFHTNLITRLAIGSGILGKVDNYCSARSQALAVKNGLIASSLIQKVEEKECVKMHDLVREVAQWIGKEDIQMIKDSTATSRENNRFVFWSADDFPDQFDGAKREILLLWISGNAPAKDPNAFFARLKKLKILFLRGEYVRKVPVPSLSNSLLSLENIHTLILDGWRIGDISVLKDLQSLVTLELKNCLIIELPKDIKQLKKLKLLGLRECKILKNNPFEVIERCSQLEELYFVDNNVKDWKPKDVSDMEDETAHDISLQLQMYSIAGSGFKRFANDDNGLVKCFSLEHMESLVPEAMFKYLAGSAQVLELGKLGQTRWKNLIPDIISTEDGGMNNLMKLYLYEWDDIDCLIDTNQYHYSNKEIFLKVVELLMYDVGVKGLYRAGAMPSGFLRQLQILKLWKCMNLQNIFRDENLKLPYLKVLNLIDCPMFQTSIFQQAIARSLVQLEELVVVGCNELKSLIACESLEEEMILVDSDQKKYGLLFPELKALHIESCDKLEMVSSLLLAGDLPKLKDLYIGFCAELKYIFRDVGHVLQQESILPSLTVVQLQLVPSFIHVFQNCNKRASQVSKEDSNEKYENSKTSAFSWTLGCCFKSPTNATLENQTISQPPQESSERIEAIHTAECLMRQPLSVQNIRKMTLDRCPKLKSLFSISLAATMIMLEELQIERCKELKHIVTNEAEDDEHLNCNSIFPKLHYLTVNYCNKLEFIFPSTFSGALPKLKSIDINGANELKYIFGRNIDLPALESLSLDEIPSMISIAMETTKTSKESSAPSERIESVIMRQPLSLRNIKEMGLDGCSKLKSLFSLSIAATMIMLEELQIERCENLKHIITNEEEDDDHLNCNSIFPKLHSLKVKYCEKLEFIFPSTLSGALPKLKSIDINGANELKYVFGRYIDLPALESLFLNGIQTMISIGIETVKTPKEMKEHMVNVTSEAANESEIEEIVDVETPLTPSVAFQYDLNFHNLKHIEIRTNKSLKTLFSISACRNLPQLSELLIDECEELVNVVEDDCNDHHHKNYSSIFPKLEHLYIWDCNKLEFIFPLSLFGTLQKLKALLIIRAAEFRCIFEKYDEGDYLTSENESDGLPIHLPALEELSLKDVPKMMNNICAKKYHPSFPSLQRMGLGGLQGFSFLDLMAHLQGIQLNANAPKDLIKMINDVQRLTKLLLKESNMEEVLNLEGVEVKGPVMTLRLEEMCLENLSELRHIWKGPKYILSLPNLQALYIRACKKLRSIFSVSIVRSLPQLSYLRIEDCDELVEIIEESGDDHLHQLCFSKLEEIDIMLCNSLKYLFSISTPHMFPKLRALKIREASEMEQVFIHKQDDMHKIVKMEEVFPKLSYVRLSELPRLITICERIDFQTIQCDVDDCPKYRQEMSQIQEGPENEDSGIQAATSASLDIAESSQEATKRSVEEVASSMNYKETEKEVGSRAVPDPASELVATTSSTFQSLEETVREVQVKDRILTSEKQASETSVAKSQLRGASLHELEDENKDLGGAKTNIEASHQINIPFDDENVTSSTVSQVGGSQSAPSTSVASMKETHEQGSHEDDATDKAAKAIQSTDSESMKQIRSSEEKKKEAVGIPASQASMAPTCLNSEITDQVIKDTIEDDALTSVESTNSDLRKQSTGPIDNLSRKDYAPNAAEEKAKGIDEKAAATNTSPIATSSIRAITIEETREHSSVREEVESKKPIKSNLPQLIPSPHHPSLIADDVVKVVGSTNFGSRKQSIGSIHNLTRNDSARNAKEKAKGIEEKASATDKSPTATPFIRETNVKETESKKSMEGSLQVIPSLYHHQSQISDAGSSPPKLGICEIFQLVELKHGETALLAQALDRYPQLLLPREHRTPRITAWSYRVLVDILVMLATKTPYTITPSEKSALEANLSEAIILGFDKEWVDSVRAMVFGVDMSDVSTAKEEIQVMEVKLGELDSQMKGLSEDRKELIEKMSMFKDIVSAKDKPFGI